MTALLAAKLALALPVRSLDVAARVAPLARGSRVDHDDPAALRFGFVFHEGPKLGEAPGVQPALPLALVGLHASPEVGQVFEHDRGARR
jgi:hypothetical protein